MFMFINKISFIFNVYRRFFVQHTTSHMSFPSSLFLCFLTSIEAREMCTAKQKEIHHWYQLSSPFTNSQQSESKYSLLLLLFWVLQKDFTLAAERKHFRKWVGVCGSEREFFQPLLVRFSRFPLDKSDQIFVRLSKIFNTNTDDKKRYIDIWIENVRECF